MTVGQSTEQSQGRRPARAALALHGLLAAATFAWIDVLIRSTIVAVSLAASFGLSDAQVLLLAVPRGGWMLGSLGLSALVHHISARWNLDALHSALMQLAVYVVLLPVVIHFTLCEPYMPLLCRG